MLKSITPLKLLLLPSFLIIFAQVCYGQENLDVSKENQKAILLYNEARRDYYSLINSKVLKEERSHWLNCILKFKYTYKKYPQSPVADKSLFTAARLYSELSDISLDKPVPDKAQESDIEKSIILFKKVIHEYPSSTLADDAEYMIGEIYFRTNNLPLAYSSYNTVIKNYPEGDMTKSAKIKLSELLKVFQPIDKQPPQSPLTKEELKGVVPLSNNLVTVKGIRHWSNPEYTRIVVDMEDKVDYKGHRVANPDRLFIDIYKSKVSPEINEPISINNGLLKGLRAGQNQSDTVRVVLDLDSIGSYSIIHLQNPFRIVIDVDGLLTEKDNKGNRESSKQIGGKINLPEQNTDKKNGSPYAHNTMKKIVIDPGHGGKDSGAIGKGGLMEKTVVLDIAKRLREIIKRKSNYEVILTRESDIFLALEDRTTIANMENAELFISIHANASRKRYIKGIETYFQGIPRTEEERETAARENMSGIDDGDSSDNNLLEFILADMRSTHKINESSHLAGVIQDSLIKGVGSHYYNVKDLGVKQALFYVLHKARMPSILIETSFISNPEEEKRFKDPKYRDYIAHAIYNGINSYLEKTIVAYRIE
ncbi:MAG: N-acetylmuramoyl-L-alanine amidase [Nitrospinota bacterium]